MSFTYLTWEQNLAESCNKVLNRSSLAWSTREFKIVSSNQSLNWSIISEARDQSKKPDIRS